MMMLSTTSSTSTVRKVMVAMLLVLVVTLVALATRAMARALPVGAQQATSGVISTNNDVIPVAPPAMRSSTH